MDDLRLYVEEYNNARAIKGHMQLRWSNMTRVTHLATAEDVKNIALYVPEVSGTIDVPSVIDDMIDSEAARTRIVRDAIFRGPPTPSQPRRGRFSAADADKQIAANTARVVDLSDPNELPSRSFCVVFTVVEWDLPKSAQSEDGAVSEADVRAVEWEMSNTRDPSDRSHDINKRRRIIMWDPEGNVWYRSTVGTQISLPHVSDSLPDIQFECATVRDGQGGFLGIPLTRYASAAYRYYDDSGRLLEPTVLPVGLSGSCELCHRVFSTIAGHPEFAKVPISSVCSKPVRVKVHVDDIRISHFKRDTPMVEQWFVDRTEKYGVRFKASTAVTGASKYTFLGLFWNHLTKTISLSQKMIRKLLIAYYKLEDGTLTYGELESLSGRLTYCTTALQYPPHWFYKISKAGRFCLWQANAYHEVARMSNWLKNSLRAWIVFLLAVPSPFRPKTEKQEAFLFTDASLKGWGAMLYTSDGRTFIIGGKWDSSYQPGQMAFLEALTVSKALKVFQPTLVERQISDINIVVDNTSVEAGVRRSCARSLMVNEGLDEGLRILYRLNIATTVRYIKSGDNPVDSVSRGQPVDWAKVGVAVSGVRRSGAWVRGST